MSVVNREKILIDFDCIMDTRLAILNNIFPDRVSSMLADGSYVGRKTDLFSIYDPRFTPDDDERFAEAYKARTKDSIMSGVVVTSLAETLGTFVSSCREVQDSVPIKHEFEIVINSFPYELTRDEMDALSESVELWFGVGTTVSVAKIPIDFLTPRNLRAEYAQWATYDFDTWLVTHKTALFEDPIPTVEVILPISVIRYPTEELDLTELTERGRREMSGVIHLNFLPLAAFSANVDLLR